jgi:IclR family transcriptional regulator, mhp operon transcriptional activator
MPKRSRTRKNSARPAPPPQVLLRGLALIEALNRRSVSSIEQLSSDTGLPKPTTVRVLHILASKGYAERLPHRRGYRLGERVVGLSSGYRSRDTVVIAARPLLATFTDQHKWPLTLATLDVDAMLVRASTLEDSPFSTSVDRGRVGRRLPLLTSALGRVYLAFCPGGEREMVLRLLRSSPRSRPTAQFDPEQFKSTLAEIVEQGYAMNPALKGEVAYGFAVPIRYQDDVLACLSMRYFGRTLSERQVARRYLTPLQDTAAQIAAAYAAHASIAN